MKQMTAGIVFAAFIILQIFSSPEIVLGAECMEVVKSIRKERNLIKKREILEKTVKECPDVAVVNYLYAYSLERLREYENALKYYKIANRLDSKSAKYFFGTGDILMILGDVKAAVEYYEKGLEINPNSKRAKKSLELARKELSENVGETEVASHESSEKIIHVTPPVTPEKQVSPTVKKPEEKTVAKAPVIDPGAEVATVTVLAKKVPGSTVKKDPPPEKIQAKKAPASEASVPAEVPEGIEKEVAGESHLVVLKPEKNAKKKIQPEQVAVLPKEKKVTPVSKKPEIKSQIQGGPILEIDNTYNSDYDPIRTSRADLADKLRKSLEGIQAAGRFELSRHAATFGSSGLFRALASRREEIERNVGLDDLNFDPEQDTVAYYGFDRPQFKNSEN